jgi:hypothetical protein
MSTSTAVGPGVPIAIGLHTDLDEAAKLATREMIDFLVSEKGMKRDDGYILCSIAADLHVTQLVDGTKGVHAMIANPFLSINNNLTTCNRHCSAKVVRFSARSSQNRTLPGANPLKIWPFEAENRVLRVTYVRNS